MEVLSSTVLVPISISRVQYPVGPRVVGVLLHLARLPGSAVLGAAEGHVKDAGVCRGVVQFGGFGCPVWTQNLGSKTDSAWRTGAVIVSEKSQFQWAVPAHRPSWPRLRFAPTLAWPDCVLQSWPELSV